MTKRLFTFGCSMTKYYYPTWADIIGREWEIFENWGRAGGGNHFIFNSVIECNARNKFTCDDTVMVLWSGLARIDAYQFNKWVHLHHKYPDHHEYASCPDGYEIISYAYMSAIEQLLDKIGCNYHVMCWSECDTQGPAGKVYKSTIDRLKSVKFSPNRQPYKISPYIEFQNYWGELYHQLAGPDWPSMEKIYNNDFANYPKFIVGEVQEFLQRVKKDKKWMLVWEGVDAHPSPVQHLDMVHKYFPDIVVSDKTVAWIKDFETQLHNGTITQYYNQHVSPERL